MKIVLDAMGGDNAPAVEVEGAIQAIQEYGHDLILVGDEGRINKELEKHGFSSGKITIKHASEVIEMHDPAAISVRRKRDSSIVVGMDLIKKDQADAFVSAGNTGAVVCAATLSLRLLPGIERPGIAIVIPTLKGTSLIIDVGANINTKPIHLLQYGIMADAYSRYLLGKTSPSVGLLSVGEEESKGTEFIKEAHTLLSESKLNFSGNIEGRDVYAGTVDIILCDGFVGNVILKISESVADTIMQTLKQEIKANFLATIGAVLSSSAFHELKKKMDYSERGGALLLGVDGRCIICHGSSTPKAIKNAIRAAAEFVKQDVNKHIIEELESY
ncbi:MAG: phosphate acyltransferase PlsX [Candidatus Omnitrophota bacterium]|nr:phosphate acyltransferase PlsX [Candidatus Omnitrophota bacterium]